MDVAVGAAQAHKCRASQTEEARLAELMKSAPANVGAMLRVRCAQTPNSEAYRGPQPDGSWKSYTWAQAGTIIEELAAGLIDLGVQPQERVAIAASTRLEWIFADFAILSAGAATTTVYPTTPTDDVAYILADSGTVVVIAEDASQVKKIEDSIDQLPELRQIVVMDTAGVELDGVRTLSLDDLAARGKALLAREADAVLDRTNATTMSDLATLIYTSGTTGRPKGVRLPHRCWVYTGQAIVAVDAIRDTDLGFMWLPLSHSFGKVLLSGQVATGSANAVDGRIDQIANNLTILKPVGMGGAPRIYEKIYARVTVGLAEIGGAKEKIFGWGFGVGTRVSQLREYGKPIPALLNLQFKIADRLVFSQVRARFGNQVRNFISGSAPLNADIARWFDAAGLRILEGYGLTETSAASFVNRPEVYRFGTVGMPLPGTSVKLDTDGEILIKSPGVMDGYHNMPEATAEVFTEDGYFRTGDIGEIDSDGFLKITDRKKELIKTSGGKYIAPGAIESLFKSVCPLASQIVVHGDRRNFVSALIALDPEAVEAWAKSNGMEGRSYAEVVASAQIRAQVEADVAEMNTKLGKWETVKKFVILDSDLTVEDGALTPSLKLRRKVVETRYKDVLDGMYS